MSEAIGKASLDSHCVLVADIDEHLQAIPPHPNMPIASYLMVPVVCTLGHYGLGLILIGAVTGSMEVYYPQEEHWQ